jgi:hypothetical protein
MFILYDYKEELLSNYKEELLGGAHICGQNHVRKNLTSP